MTSSGPEHERKSVKKKKNYRVCIREKILLALNPRESKSKAAMFTNIPNLAHHISTRVLPGPLGLDC